MAGLADHSVIVGSDKNCCCLQTPLAGFNLVPDVYELYYPDRLHQSNKGTAEVLAEMVQDKVMQTGHLHMLNEYLTCLPSYFGVRIPGFGLDSKKRANATQCADLFKLLPVAILAIPGVKSLFASNSRYSCYSESHLS